MPGAASRRDKEVGHNGLLRPMPRRA